MSPRLWRHRSPLSPFNTGLESRVGAFSRCDVFRKPSAHFVMHTVAVIGLGYVGLPLSLRFAEIGDRVIGLDVDETKIEKLRAGQTYIKHLTADRIATAVKQGTFDPSTDVARVAEAEAVILCVPTPLTRQREPDL